MKKWYYKLKESENYNVIILAVMVAIAAKTVHYMYLSGVQIYYAVQWGGDLFDSGTYLSIVSCGLAFVFFLLAGMFAACACRKDPKFMICAIVSLAVSALMGVSFCAVQCIIACVYWMWMVKGPSEKPEAYHIKRITLILVIVSVVIFVVWELSVWLPFGNESLKDEIYFALQWMFGNCFNPEIVLIAYLYKCSQRKLFKNLCRVLAVIWIAVTIGSLLTSLGSVVNFGVWEEWGSDTLEEGDWSEWTTEDDITYGTDEDGNVTFEMEAEDADIYYDEEGNGSTYQSFEFE